MEPMVEQIEEAFEKDKESPLKEGKVLADSGYHSTETLEYLEEHKIDAYVADTGFRSRDPRFQDAKRHKAKSSKSRYGVDDFQVDLDQKTCVCPAGKEMWLKSAEAKIGNNIFMQFQGYQKACDGCLQRAKCLRSVNQKGARQVNIRIGSVAPQKRGALERMRQKIDSNLGRHIYSMRLGIVEPVFGNITDALGIKRFTLRGKRKVDGQWKLMTMLHNMLKIHRYGMAS